MRSSIIISVPATLFYLITSVGGKPFSSASYKVVERREELPRNWVRRSKADADAALLVRIALTQSNLHLADDFIEQVAGPQSPSYGQHWSVDQIAATFAPSPETVAGVKSWLHDAGIAADQIFVPPSRGWLTFLSDVKEVERLLKLEYHVYENEETGVRQLASRSYSVPADIRKHVDFITPTLYFDGAAAVPQDRKSRRTASRSPVPGGEKIATNNTTGPLLISKSREVLDGSPPTNISTCDSKITLECLRALYGIPDVNITAANNSLGIVEYSPQSYRQEDLDMFFATYAPSMVGQSPILDSIDGGALDTAFNSSFQNAESNLDLQYAMGLAQHSTLALYQTGDIVRGAYFNNFLDAIDGSYCSYDGGDDPLYDVTYPHTGPGYNGPKTCGDFVPTQVISTSYYADELSLSAAYEQRQCYEYMKLALRGITVIFCSGDWGVAGIAGECVGQYGIQDVFRPSFPSTCPYVTAVGATEVPSGSEVTLPEVAAATFFHSGGGFSNVFPLPSWQEGVLANYWANHDPGYSFQQFNNSQKARGIPDVAMNGVNYVVASDDKFTLAYGTSASAPAFAALITHINDELLNAGKNPVGFINPVLYAHPEVLNDITQGNNPGCSTTGFEAVEGWDPVTGLGTPNYQKMLALFMSLQ